MFTRAMLMLTVALMLGLAVSAGGADAAEKAAFEARLKAGREAAYKKYLPRPGAGQGAAGAKPRIAVGPQTAKPHAAGVRVLPGARHIFAGHATPYAFGDLRYNFYDNLNLYRQQRYTDYPLAPYIYQPVWDWRYRRSWPRPVRVREYVRSHWLWDGARYTYVPGHAEYRTEWITQGWPRYHWRGSHYSVSVSFNR